MKQLTFLTALLALSFSLKAQLEYSYIQDRVFMSPNDFIGYTFVPNEEQSKEDRNPSRINPGAITFTAVPSYLKVKEFGSEEVLYNMNSINPIKGGYKFDLMNAQNPSEQGHLKLIFNDKKQVDALIFKRNQQAVEMIYFQASVPQKTSDRDVKYFTDVTDINVANTQFLYGKTITPFFQNDKVKSRLYPKDSLSFRFVETTVGEGKKQKKARMLIFKYMGHDEEGTETDVIEESYEIKKEADMEYELNGVKGIAVEMELKNCPAGNIRLILDMKRNLQTIQFGTTFFTLRDKLVHGAVPK